MELSLWDCLESLSFGSDAKHIKRLLRSPKNVVGNFREPSRANDDLLSIVIDRWDWDCCKQASTSWVHSSRGISTTLPTHETTSSVIDANRFKPTNVEHNRQRFLSLVHHNSYFYRVTNISGNLLPTQKCLRSTTNYDNRHAIKRVKKKERHFEFLKLSKIQRDANTHRSTVWRCLSHSISVSEESASKKKKQKSACRWKKEKEREISNPRFPRRHMQLASSPFALLTLSCCVNRNSSRFLFREVILRRRGERKVLAFPTWRLVISSWIEHKRNLSPKRNIQNSLNRRTCDIASKSWQTKFSLCGRSWVKWEAMRNIEEWTTDNGQRSDESSRSVCEGSLNISSDAFRMSLSSFAHYISVDNNSYH